MEGTHSVLVCTSSYSRLHMKPILIVTNLSCGPAQDVYWLNGSASLLCERCHRVWCADQRTFVSTARGRFGSHTPANLRLDLVKSS